MKVTAYAPVASALSAAPASLSLRDRQAATVREKLKVQKQALITLKQQTEAHKDDARALARKRVDQLKERLKMLEQMPGLDPAKKARLIAQLTKELKSAVKAYASAGGSALEVGTTGTPAAPAADIPPDSLTDSPTDSDTPETPSDATSPDATNSDSAPPTDATKDRDRPASPYDHRSDADRRKSAEAEEDAAFARDVRDMMRKIKALLDKAKTEARTRISHNDKAPDDIRDAEAALRALDKEVGMIESTTAATDLMSGLRLSLSV